LKDLLPIEQAVSVTNKFGNKCIGCKMACNTYTHTQIKDKMSYRKTEIISHLSYTNDPI